MIRSSVCTVYTKLSTHGLETAISPLLQSVLLTDAALNCWFSACDSLNLVY